MFSSIFGSGYFSSSSNAATSVPPPSTPAHEEAVAVVTPEEAAQRQQKRQLILLAKALEKLEREYASLRTLLHGSDVGAPRQDVNAMAASSRQQKGEEGKGGKFAVTDTKTNKTHHSLASDEHTPRRVPPRTSMAVRASGFSSSSNASGVAGVAGGGANSGSGVPFSSSPPSPSPASSSNNTSANNTTPSSVLLLPADRAAAITPEQWQAHSDFLLGAAEPHDPLFHSLARVALFCQLRAGGAEFDPEGRSETSTMTPASTNNAANEEVCESAGSSLFPFPSLLSSASTNTTTPSDALSTVGGEGDEVMCAIEAIRQSIGDRCALIRDLIRYADETAGPEIMATVSEDAVAVAMLHSNSTCAVGRGDGQGGREKQQRNQQKVSPAAGAGSPSPFVSIATSDEGPAEEEGGPDLCNSFNSASSALSNLRRGGGCRNGGEVAVGGTPSSPLAPPPRPPFTPLRYAVAKRRCLELLGEGRGAAPLFALLDDAAAFCCAHGHALEAICIVPQEEINRVMAAARRGGGGEGEGGNEKANADPPVGSSSNEPAVASDGANYSAPHRIREGPTTTGRSGSTGSTGGNVDRVATETIDSDGTRRLASGRRAPPRRNNNGAPRSLPNSQPSFEGEEGSGHTTNIKREKKGSSSSSPTAAEAHVVRLPNGVLATVMVEVSLEEMDVEAEARRLLEVQEVAKAMTEVRDLQRLIALESQRQGDLLARAEDAATEGHALAVKARKHLGKAARHKAVFVTIAGGLIGAAVGGPIGLAVGAKTAAAIVGASAIGGVGTAVATSAMAARARRVVLDEDYEEEQEAAAAERAKGGRAAEGAVARRRRENEGAEDAIMSH